MDARMGGLSQIPHFDPRSAPVIERGIFLPKVPLEQQTPVALRRRFTHPPAWSPEIRKESRDMQLRVTVPAAVLIPLMQRDELTVLLTQRTEHLASHAGQIAFPGGKKDKNDIDAIATALREAEEEIGLAAQQVDVLGVLPHYQTGTGYTVTPVVALVSHQVCLQANPDEVKSIFEVPLDFVLNPVNHFYHQMQWQGRQREWFSIPYDDAGQERFIWGATAGMLRNLYRFMSA